MLGFSKPSWKTFHKLRELSEKGKRNRIARKARGGLPITTWLHESKMFHSSPQPPTQYFSEILWKSVTELTNVKIKIASSVFEIKGHMLLTELKAITSWSSCYLIIQ